MLKNINNIDIDNIPNIDELNTLTRVEGSLIIDVILIDEFERILDEDRNVMWFFKTGNLIIFKI
jgi:hypothetical protein